MTAVLGGFRHGNIAVPVVEGFPSMDSAAWTIQGFVLIAFGLPALRYSRRFDDGSEVPPSAMPPVSNQ